jgi:ATP-binding cassette subfamily F protein 3
MTLLVQAAGIHYAHGGNQIFDGLSFEIRDGDRIALIGENGAGKSTLFRLLVRELDPDEGAVTRRRNLTVGYLSQHSSVPPHLTARESVALAGGDPAALELQLRDLEQQMAEPLTDDELADVLEQYGDHLARMETASSGDLEARVAQSLAGLGFPESRWDTQVGRLSGGEKQIVALAGFLVEEPDLLLLDEPDNHLDMTARAWLETYLRERRGALVVISHDRYFIDRVANSIVELEDSRMVAYPGNYSAYLTQKRERLEREEQLYELRVREMKKLKASAEQLTQWARQNPKFAARAGNKRRLLEIERERMDSTPVPMLERRKIDVELTGTRGSTIVVEARGLSKSYGEREVIKPFNFEMTHGERVGIVGPNGSGKTTLFRLILGTEAPTSGTIRIGATINVGYYAQEQETLDPNMTPLELVRKAKPMNEQQAISFLVGLLFDRQDSVNKIGNLSGGERSRLQVAMLVLRGANFLLLDEPTNNLDIASIEVLEDALLEFQGSILTISHDRFYLDKLCTRIIELDNGDAREYAGGYSYYNEHRGQGSDLTIRPVLDSRKRHNVRR